MSVFYCTYIRSSTLSRLPHASALSRFINIDEDMLYIYYEDYDKTEERQRLNETKVHCRIVTTP